MISQDLATALPNAFPSRFRFRFEFRLVLFTEKDLLATDSFFKEELRADVLFTRVELRER